LAYCSCCFTSFKPLNIFFKAISSPHFIHLLLSCTRFYTA
jgi:hypothetical protein